MSNQLDATHPAVAMALAEALCSPDEVADFIVEHCNQKQAMPDAADRLLRMPGRIEGADVASLVSAAMLSAYRGDMQTAGECWHQIAMRYVARRAAWISTRCGELERDLEEDRGVAA